MNSGLNIRALFDSIDAQDSDKFVSFFAPDARFQFGNWPPSVGRVDIRAAVAQFFTTIKVLSHRLTGEWSVGDTVIVRGEVAYTRQDGSQITLPFCNVFGLHGELIKDYQIYMDVNPLYQGSA